MVRDLVCGMDVNESRIEAPKDRGLRPIADGIPEWLPVLFR